MLVSIRKRPLLTAVVVGLLVSAFGTAPGLAGIPQPPPRDPIVDGPEDADLQHGDATGHLPGSSDNVELVGQVDVSGATGVDRPSHIADVATFRNYAYLAARRLNTQPCGAGGIYVIDISDPTDPTEVGFIAFPPQSYPGEGVDVIKVNTPSFKGDLLLTNNENCTNTDAARVGGMSLYDVTNPLAPVPLAVGVGDTNGGTLTRANQTHSVLGWQAGRKAFAVQIDNAEQVTNDVDIFDITNPAPSDGGRGWARGLAGGAGPAG